MYTSQEILRRPSSSGVNYNRDIYATTNTQPSFAQTNTEIFLQSHRQSIPLNQTSFTSLAPVPRETFRRFKSPINPSSKQNSVLNTQKVYFTYISPGSLKVEKRYIETMTLAPNKPFSNEWEERYFELQKQINSFIIAHEKMVEELCSLKEEIKSSHLGSAVEQEQSIPINYQEKYEELLKVYEELKVDASKFMDQNIKIQNSLCEAQKDLREEKENIKRVESEKMYAVDQFKELEFKLREEQLVNTDIISERNKLIEENYQIRIEISTKEKEITDILMKTKKEEEKIPEKAKVSEKMSQERFEEKLMRIKGEFEKKEKKFEKQLQEKVKEIENFRSYITEVEEKERNSRELREKFEQLYNEKKEEANIFYKNLQESSILEAEGEKIYYEQRISDLNKIAQEKEAKIRKMEQEKKKMELKISQYGDNYVNERQLAELRKTIDKLNHQLLEKGGVIYNELDNRAEPYDNGKIFEEKLIYELKRDNQKMVKLLSKISLNQQIVRPNVVINQNITLNNESGTSLGLAMKGMIADTFSKLEGITKGINSDPLLGEKKNDISLNNSPEKIRKSKESPRKRKSSERHSNFNEKNLTKITSDLEILKSYIFDLSETCEKLMKQLEKEERIMNVISRQQTEELKTERKMNSIIPKEEELISFFKTKNEELDKRVQELIGINNSLKEKLSIKYPQDKSSFEYWQNEVSESKKEIEEITIRYNKLLDKLKGAEVSKQVLDEKCLTFSTQIERLEQLLKESQSKLAMNATNERGIEELMQSKTKIERELDLSKYENKELQKKLDVFLNGAIQGESKSSIINCFELSYELELLRSILLEVDCLIEEVPFGSDMTEILKEGRSKINEGLTSIKNLQGKEF